MYKSLNNNMVKQGLCRLNSSRKLGVFRATDEQCSERRSSLLLLLLVRKSTTTQYQISSIVHLTTVSCWCTRLRHQFNQGLNEELKHFYGGLGEDLPSI